jgi:N6-L-threonylcarbamoyladenine synthase
MVLLAIETSCDDTGIAIFKNNKLLSNVVATSMNLHKKYGGIIPEIAARQHEKNLLPCLNKTLKQAKINVKEITHVVYTSEPGLPGSLHVGKVFAKSLASLLNAQLIKVNHLCGHAFSFALTHNEIKYPFISLIVSGGETAIYLFKNKTTFKVLNKTADDAVGEVLDKIGRQLKLPYPGGKSIDKIYDEKKSHLHLINHFNPSQPFSFSGLKTHVLNIINNKKIKDKTIIASSSLK